MYRETKKNREKEREIESISYSVHIYSQSVTVYTDRVNHLQCTQIESISYSVHR